MEHFVVSARKYRPKTFNDVVGQQAITNTLLNAIENNHLAQALLFCGPRGVGKTSCARILAKKINHQEGHDDENEDFAFNVFELDAASNRGVEEITQLFKNEHLSEDLTFNPMDSLVPDEFYFDNYIKNGNSILRPIHYPPIKTEPKGAERAAAHGDINLITLLMGAQGRGLQVQDNDGVWHDAIAQPDEIMINVGDMLSRHSNNKLKSTIHRVTNPPKELWGTSRYSIPFFMHPISEMKLDVLESCIDDENPKQFEDITAGEFLNERLRELGLIK